MNKHYNSAKEKEDIRAIINIFNSMSDMGKHRVYEELTLILPTGYCLGIHITTLNIRDHPLNFEDVPLKEDP